MNDADWLYRITANTAFDYLRRRRRIPIMPLLDVHLGDVGKRDVETQVDAGFYLHTGFEIVGRSERDGLGKPYPLLHLHLATKV